MAEGDGGDAGSSAPEVKRALTDSGEAPEGKPLSTVGPGRPACCFVRGRWHGLDLKWVCLWSVEGRNAGIGT